MEGAGHRNDDKSGTLFISRLFPVPYFFILSLLIGDFICYWGGFIVI